MAELVSQFLNHIGAYRILGASGVEPQCRDTRQFVACPTCKRAAYIVGSAVVCSGRHCDWRLGSVVDYVAKAQNQTHRQVLQVVREAYPQLTDTIGGVPWADTVDHLVHAMQQQHELHRFLIDRRGKPDTLTSEMAAAQAWLETQGVELTKLKDTLVLLTAKECRELAQRIALITDRAQEEWPHAFGAIVVPYFSDLLSISHFSVIPFHPDPCTSKHASWNVTPTRVAFSGLWECHTGTLEGVRCVNAPFKAAALTQHQMGLSSGALYLGIVNNRRLTNEASLRFKHASYLLKRENESLGQMMELKLLTAPGGLSAGYVESPDSVTPWLNFLAKRWDWLLRVQGNTETVKRDASSLALTTQERLEWKAYVEAHGYANIAEFMSSASGNVQRTYNVQGAVISETETGYKVAAGKSAPAACTNFTVELFRNVSFPDSEDIHHQGVMHFRSVDYPIFVKNNTLMKVTDFVRAMRLSYSNAEQKELMPSVFSTKLATYLSQMFSQQIAVLPRIYGTKSLGWSNDRQQFVAPQWRTTASGLAYRETCGDRTLDILNSYDFTPKEAPALRKTAPAWAGELLAILVGQTARAQRGRPAYPVVFQDTAELGAAMSRIFLEAFGQKRPVMFDHNYRGFRNIDLLGGYPCLTTGSLPGHALAKCTLPFILLSDSGRSFDIDEDLEGGIQFIASMYPAVVAWLTKTSAAEVSFCQTQLHEQDVLQDGLNILKKAVGYTWTGRLSETPVLQTVLQLLPVSKVTEIFRQCFETQRLVIQLDTSLKQFQPTLWAELTLQDETFNPGDVANMDLMTGMRLLTDFYRTAPNLPNVANAKPTQEEWALSAVEFRRANAS
jgi:hypothetical protein